MISGTSTFISVTAKPAGAVATPHASNSFNPNEAQLPGLPPTPEGNNGTFKSSNNKSDSNVPTAALAAVCGVAAVALIVFGLVMTRKRKQRRQEESDREGGYGKSLDYEYDSTMASTGRGLSNAPPAAAYDDLPDFIPYIAPVPVAMTTTSAEYEHAEADMAVAAASVGAAGYGFERLSGEGIHRRVSDRSDGSLSLAVASAGNAAAATTVASESSGAVPFPMPLSTSEALKQQFELLNRFSITSQDFKPEDNTTSKSATTGVALGSGAAAAAAVNQQMSLKKQLEEEVTKGPTSNGDSESLYYLETDSHSPNQQYESARSHTASPSSAYGTADSPTLSAVSASSPIGIHMPALPPSDWRLTGSGRPESSHIRDLIRNVLDDD
ncbi:hypothetical protein BGZ68_000090 [Mortierella alpina]|nr:hypothetical protein BGZ68_000090 [Mortierella alpina]